MRARAPRSCPGFTLIEVVVGLMLLATLLVSLLLALARHKRADELAEMRHTATLVADQLLAGWMDAPEGIPVSASGGVAGRTDWTWRTSVLSNRMVFGIPTAIVRVDIIRSQAQAVVISVEAAVAVTRLGG